MKGAPNAAWLRRMILMCLFAGPTAVLADDAADKSQYNVLNPTPEAELRSFSSDRPARGFTPFTVDAGHFQYEMDFVNVSRSVSPAMAQTSFLTLDPIFKIGVTNQIDFGVELGGLNRQVTRNFATASDSTIGGFGDLTLLPRFNLFGDDGGKAALAVMPYVKLPTAAAGIGNRAVEGGVIVPLVIKLPDEFVMSLTNEADVLKNETGFRHHANFVEIVSLERPVPYLKDMIAEVEFYSSAGTDRMTPPSRTLDVSLQYLVTPNWQLDAGANFGLNKDAPRWQFYTGVAQRF
jgi:Putative MetA-pathway of phenol degradation